MRASARCPACRRLSAIASSAGSSDAAEPGHSLEQGPSVPSPVTRRHRKRRRRRTLAQEDPHAGEPGSAADAAALRRIAEPDAGRPQLRSALRARSTPMRSTGSSVSAVRRYRSARSECRRGDSGTSIWSRVVPGMSVTMARSCPAIALIRLDLPAFGGPATTTRTPSFNGSTRGRSSQAAALPPALRSRRARAGSRPTSSSST